MVVVNPGWGDAVQANKAGLIEVADVFVINKADRPGAEQTQRDLEDALGYATRERHRPAIVKTSASNGEGVEDLWQAIVDHRAWLEESGELERRRAERIDRELREIIVRRLEEKADGLDFSELHEQVLARELDPYAAADKILEGLE
jgi:LAO/AO transport system kinase